MIKTLLKYRNYFLSFSILLVISSMLVISLFGFKLGIDFTSGSLWQIRAPGASTEDIRNFFHNDLSIDEINISFDEQTSIYTLSLKELSDGERKDIAAALQERFGEGTEDLDFWSVSPVVSQELRSKAAWAVVLVLVGISLYITIAFRKVSKPVSSWKYGLITLITLSHDVLLPAGLFALLGYLMGVTVDINFVVALLVVMGFSVHDTIVIFDRIRENLLEVGDKKSIDEVVDQSIISTMARSINTSLTLILVLVALYLWGPLSLKYFILAILVGTVAGTYSSIFVASPLLVWAGKRAKRK
ncbi:MAG: protein translocase subunit SecF [Candidatus Colwellbacteria bacterium]